MMLHKTDDAHAKRQWSVLRSRTMTMGVSNIRFKCDLRPSEQQLVRITSLLLKACHDHSKTNGA